MDKSYKKSIQMFSEALSNPELVNYARKNGIWFFHLSTFLCYTILEY